MQSKPNDLWFPDLAHEAVEARWHIPQAQGPSFCEDCFDLELCRLFALHDTGGEHSASGSELEE